LQAAHGCEAEIGVERVAHRVDETLGTARREAVLPPDAENLYFAVFSLDARLDPPDEAVSEDDREHVVAPAAPGRREEALPDEVEVEQVREERGVPQQRVERRDERDRGGRLRGSLQ